VSSIPDALWKRVKKTGGEAPQRDVPAFVKSARPSSCEGAGGGFET